MIEAYVGYIGGGKSVSAVKRALVHMASGGVVVSNMRLMLDPWFNPHPIYCERNKPFEHEGQECNAWGVIECLRRHYRWEYQLGQYRYVSDEKLMVHGLAADLPAGNADIPVLVIFDECADFWDTENRKKADDEFLSVIRHSRKLALDFVFIIQDLSELNKRLRNQTVYVSQFLDMATFKVPGLKMGLGFIPGVRNLIRYMQFWRRDFESGRSAEPVDSGWMCKDQYLYGCYKTDALHMSLGVAMGVKTDFRGQGALSESGSAWLVPVGYGLAAGVALGGLFL